jgi:hypothetical protein
MSNQYYDKSEIIQEIIETIKNGSKSHSQMVRDLLARGIPASEVDTLMKSVARELYPTGDSSIKPSIVELPTAGRTIRKQYGHFMLIVLLVYDFILYILPLLVSSGGGFVFSGFVLFLLIPNILIIFFATIILSDQKFSKVESSMLETLSCSITIVGIAFICLIIVTITLGALLCCVE